MSCPRSGRVPAPRRGIVLYMVVAIVLMMTLLTYGFLLSMQTENMAAGQAGDQLRARQAAFSAREIVCWLMEQDYASRRGFGGLVDNPNRLRDIRLVFENEEFDPWTARGFVMANPRDKRFGVENQSAKINLGTLLAMDSASPGSARQVLMRLPAMTESVADRMMDWMDEDDQPREFGAESDFYLENFGYPARNGLPESLQEFERIPEVTAELLFGQRAEEADVERKQDTGSFETILIQGQTDEPVKAWSDYLTLRSGERNESFDGRPRINLNEPDLFALHAELLEWVDLETANFVILARQYGIQPDPVATSGTSRSGLQSPSQFTPDWTLPAEFELGSPLDLIGAVVAMGDAEEEVEGSDGTSGRTLIRSPFSGATTTNSDLLENLLDRTTTQAGQVIEGRVNILLAPREVLLSVPGIDEELASRIIANRENSMQTAKTCFWLLSTRLINMEQMKVIAPHVTQRGEVCRFLFGGWSDSASAPLVYETLIDATGGSARQVECRKIFETRAIHDFFRSGMKR